MNEQPRPNAFAGGSNRERGYAAVLIDFENLYYFLTGQYVDHPDVNDAVFDLLRNLRNHLESIGLHPIIQHAYGDFERLKTMSQGSLYLMGIDSHNVLGTDHKNAADMRLCIEAMQILYTRPEISTFVVVSGDRDYIPVVQHLRRQARSVLVAAFKSNTSGDLLLNVGEQNFIEAMDLIDPKMIRRLEIAVRKQQEVAESIRDRASQPVRPSVTASSTQAPQAGSAPATDATVPKPVKKVTPVPSGFGPTFEIRDENQRKCLEVMLDNFGQYPEIFLSPFLRVLSDALPRLADYERKALLNDLEAAGAIRIEKRKGEPFDYSVIVVNWNHATVRELMP